MISQPLPRDLHLLFRGKDPDQYSITTPLPTGRTVLSDEGDGEIHTLWLSDQPATADLFSSLRAEHPQSGLWPLLLDAHDRQDPEYRPWGTGELFPEGLTSPDAHQPAAQLSRWWHDYTCIDDDDDNLRPDERLAVTAPFGERWPGLAPAGHPRCDPDQLADEYAEALLARRPWLRLGLIAASSGATALTAAGWQGPVNYDSDTAIFSAILSDWERRFGARMVCAGFDTLSLSVAAAPADRDTALVIAAEHFAFCPDNIWQATGSLTAYADQLIDAHEWEFWWD
ncbi:DUF4253 domain-containing protein [Streptomyces sp. AK02-01A]|uniref:DUF4253 domain-containing protein n=1 Tax=Streptomyces sp. AK02-01A TaxID=3028648 RepID=UPI0029BE363D|nr:DUF4253 domain-containing protein [Streptomyces sp. AK02-01A]MDX3854162.1 DUF4253 domain-containing protein [Streptomyces sp. AK02-01A]